MSSKAKKDRTSFSISPNNLSKAKFIKKLRSVDLSFPIHPFLFAIFPVLAFYSNNISELLPNVLVNPLLAVALGVVLLLTFFSLIFRSKEKARILTSLFVILFFSYGHIKNAVGDFHYDLKIITIGPDKTLFVIWGTLFFAGTYFLIRSKRNFYSLTKPLNIIALILVAFSLVNIVYYEFQTKRLFRPPTESTGNIEPTEAELMKSENLPDIYYIIFDRYAGMHTLKEFYKYDNNDFIKYLNDKGFYLATESHANYPASFLSIASSLNMGYINHLTDVLGENSKDQTKAFEMIQNFKVQSLLKSIGYKYIHIGNAWEPTRKNKNADKNFIYRPENLAFLDIDEFSTKLLETTISPPIFTKIFGQDNQGESPIRIDHRNRALYQFEVLLEIPNLIKGPKFVFAHLIFPHPAYVLDQNCDPVTKEDNKKLGELKSYLNQLICANKKIKTVVDGIHKQSNNSAVIILQADTGPVPPLKNRFSENFAESSNEALSEATNILNAYYLPNKDKKILYDSVTPVNTFRLIFNLYLGTNYKLLPDKIYMFKDLEHPYKFYDVTDKVLN